MVVLLNLLLFGRLGAALCLALFHVRLERRNLLVDICNVLLDNESEFLKLSCKVRVMTGGARQVTRTLISTGRSSNSVLRFATEAGQLVALQHEREGMGAYIVPTFQALQLYC